MQPLGDAHREFVFIFQIAINLEIVPVRIILDRSDAIFGDFGQD